MTITDSTFEETCEGAIENGFAVVDGKKVKVMRIWEFCHFTYCVSYVIICDCAEAAAAPAAIGATSEDPKSFGKSIIFVALGEGIALYGLLISILILGKF